MFANVACASLRRVFSAAQPYAPKLIKSTFSRPTPSFYFRLSSNTPQSFTSTLHHTQPIPNSAFPPLFPAQYPRTLAAAGGAFGFLGFGGSDPTSEASTSESTLTNPSHDDSSLDNNDEIDAYNAVMILTRLGNPAIPTLIRNDIAIGSTNRQAILQFVTSSTLDNMPTPQFDQNNPRYSVKMVLRKLIHDLYNTSMYVVPILHNLTLVNSAATLYNRDMGITLIPEMSLKRLTNLQRLLVERYLHSMSVIDDIDTCSLDTLPDRYLAINRLVKTTHDDLNVFNLINHAIHVHHKEQPFDFLQHSLKSQQRYLAGRRAHMMNKARNSSEWLDMDVEQREQYLIDLIEADSKNVSELFDQQKEYEEQRWRDLKLEQDASLVALRNKISAAYLDLITTERRALDTQNAKAIDSEKAGADTVEHAKSGKKGKSDSKTSITNKKPNEPAPTFLDRAAYDKQLDKNVSERSKVLADSVKSDIKAKHQRDFTSLDIEPISPNTEIGAKLLNGLNTVDSSFEQVNAKYKK